MSLDAILLTSTFPRHLHVAGVVARGLRLRGLWLEEKSFVPERYATSEEEHAVIARHFDARDAAEDRDFAGAADAAAAFASMTRRVPAGGINHPDELAAMQALAPDVVLVFGTGLLRAPIVDAFAGRIINIHLGLSPFYRGSGTNFWPLVNREPEYVGATIHYLDAGIDTGPIIAHVRPAIDAGDDAHAIGNRAIAAAADALVDAARAHAAGRVTPVPQTAKGRLYQRRDFSASAVQRLYDNFATGMIAEYLAARAERDARVPLVALQPA